MAHRTFASVLTLMLTLAISAVALAAGPQKGKTYKGTTPKYGVSSEGGHKIKLETGAITLKVSSNGKTVTVHFASSLPILYCQTTETLHEQTSAPAKISGSGSFKAIVDERFKAGIGAPSIVQTVTGKFSGGTVKGTIRTEPAECGGSAGFSAST